MKRQNIGLPSKHVYVHKNDIKRLENNSTLFVFIEPEGNPNDYEKVNSNAFQPVYKVDTNKYQATRILKQ